MRFTKSKEKRGKGEGGSDFQDWTSHVSASTCTFQTCLKTPSRVVGFILEQSGQKQVHLSAEM